MADETTSDPDSRPPDPGIPEQGRLAGIDFGTVRVGIAICDAGQMIASPLEVYQRRSDSKDAEYFSKLVATENIKGFVLGLPLHMSGDESEKSKQTRAFGEWLWDLTQLPVAYYDERLTTALAREILGQSTQSAKKKKGKLDKLAAQIILSSYLESNRSGSDQGSLDQ